ncbi:hypothetical protein [Nocardioides sp. Leaf374]|nr:hypothetical protein [Nocardioides sp. Leaf374]
MSDLLYLALTLTAFVLLALLAGVLDRSGRAGGGGPTAHAGSADDAVR